MKRRQVVWSDDALDEIDAVIAYIAKESPAAASRVSSAIRKCGVALGRAATGRPGRMGGTFEKVVPHTPYLLAYALNDEAAVVVILRVIHGARDWSADRWPNVSGEEQP